MNKKEINQNLPILALIAASIFGVYFRIYPVLQADFPLNDGGMFVTLTEELLANNFILPEFSNYNMLQIPYAYPPLGFYLAAFLTRITNQDVLSIFRLVPAVISWLTIPAFYLAAKKLLKSALTISIAVIIFAIIPRSWLWMIMGGSFTRVLGMLFSILTIYFGIQLFTKQKGLLPTILCFTLTVLSHPEALIFAALNLGLLFLFHQRTTKGFVNLALVVLGALVASSLWWITVLIRHGSEPFFSASQTGGLGLIFILRLLAFNLTGEPTPALFASLAVIGVFYALNKKQFFLPVSAVATIILIPRSGPNYLMIPVAMLAAFTIGEVIFPAFSTNSIPSRTAKILLGYFLVSLFIAAIVAPNTIETNLRILSQDERQAMQWVSDNTDADSQFLVLSSANWWHAPAVEWFPYLSQRRSLNTVQGTEWLPDKQFILTIEQAESIKACLDQTTACLKLVQSEYQIPFSHLYLVTRTETNPFIDTRAFELELRQDQDFELIYEGDGGLVFAFQP